MDYHKNARLTVRSREQLAKRVLEQGLTLKLTATSFNVSARTAAKWVNRYREKGAAGLEDRSSRPGRLPPHHLFFLRGKGFSSAPAAP